MNRYERYKDSGIPWLGEVPEHWDKIAIHYLVNLKSGDSITALDLVENGEYPVFGGGGFRGYINSFTHSGQFNLIGRQGALCGNVTLANGKFFATEHAIVVTPIKKLDTKWLYYLLITMNLNQYSTSAAQPGISAEVIGRLRVPFPNFKEQTAIAHYLDTKLGEIDALIDKQQTLLEKLAEQRTAVITQAVTKGLNPAAPMKNSGVEWLGDVPAHWDIKHSNQIFKIHNGATPKTSEPDYWGDEIVWFTPKDLGDNQNKEISTSLKMITKEGYENCGVSLAPAKSIALSKRAPIGHLAITLLPAVVNQGCFLLEVLAPNDVNYLYYWLYANKPTLNSFGQGSTFMELPREKFAMLKISTPPKAEQTSIAEYLDNETAKIDRLCETVNQTIGRLKEYRTALITQAVTGKIKVTDE